MKTFAQRRWYLFIPLIPIAIAAFGFVTMWLWNTLMPYLFHLPLISFWQAIGLLILSRLLFGGPGHHRHGPHRHWDHSMRAKWEKMTPEEREQFMQSRRRWGSRCGCYGPEQGETNQPKSAEL